MDSVSSDSSSVSATAAIPGVLYGLPSVSTCVEPDHRELIQSVGVVLARRVRDNETNEMKLAPSAFCEDFHTEPEPADSYDVVIPLLHLQAFGGPTLYTLSRVLPPPPMPREHYTN